MRGKNGTATATRREAAAVENEIATYQRKVRELSSELAETRAQQMAEREQASRERRVLRAELAEGISPELAARDKVIVDLRAECGNLRVRHERLLTTHAGTFNLLVAVLIQSGMLSDAAIGWICSRIPDVEGRVNQIRSYGLVVPNAGLDAEAVERIQRARGFR